MLGAWLYKCNCRSVDEQQTKFGGRILFQVLLSFSPKDDFNLNWNAKKVVENTLRVVIDVVGEKKKIFLFERTSMRHQCIIDETLMSSIQTLSSIIEYNTLYSETSMLHWWFLNETPIKPGQGGHDQGKAVMVLTRLPLRYKIWHSQGYRVHLSIMRYVICRTRNRKAHTSSKTWIFTFKT